MFNSEVENDYHKGKIRSLHVPKYKNISFRMVKQSLIDIFIKQIYSKPVRKNYDTNKTVVKNVDFTWSIDLLHMIDHGLKNNKCYRYILVAIDIFSNYGWGIHLKNNTAQFITNEISDSIHKTNPKPFLMETDDGRVYK